MITIKGEISLLGENFLFLVSLLQKAKGGKRAKYAKTHKRHKFTLQWFLLVSI